MMALGASGLISDAVWNISDQLDNGNYGFQRALSIVGGPTVGMAGDAFNVVSGTKAAFLGQQTKGGKETNVNERTGVRSLVSRLPGIGGQRDIREQIVDAVAGKRKAPGDGWGQFGKLGAGWEKW